MCSRKKLDTTVEPAAYGICPNTSVAVRLPGDLLITDRW